MHARISSKVPTSEFKPNEQQDSKSNKELESSRSKSQEGLKKSKSSKQKTKRGYGRKNSSKINNFSLITTNANGLSSKEETFLPLKI